MKATGNGRPERCVANLINLWQGEVPYARLKGMPTELVDKPVQEAIPAAKNHAAWLISNYEPRVTLTDVETEFDSQGNLQVIPKIVVNEE